LATSQSPRPVTYTNLTVAGVVRNTQVYEDSSGSGIYGGFGTGNGARMTRKFYARQGLNANGELPEQIARDFLGFSEKVGAGSNAYISRTIPHCKSGVDTRRFYAEDIPLLQPTNQAVGKDAYGLPASHELEVTVTYSERKYRILTDQELVAVTGGPVPNESFLARYVSWEQQTAANYQSLPSTTALEWRPEILPGVAAVAGVSGAPVLNKRFVIFNEADVFITWHDIPIDAVPWTAINNCIGKTNAFGLGGHVLTFVPLYPAETLICMAPMIRTKMNPLGLLQCDITYRLKYYPYGANNFYRWEGGVALPDGSRTNFLPVRYNTGDMLFVKADFLALFKPEP